MKKIVAEEGKVYTDGESYGKEVYMSDKADASIWRQIDEKDILPQGDATEADKDAALRRFGVEV